MGEEKRVSWFEVKRDPLHFRIGKWVIAVMMALFLNWFYINGIPVAPEFEMVAPQASDSDDELMLEMVDELDEMNYVETNPDALENEPDETANISNRDQQSAQENVAGPETSESPFSEGDDEASPKIIEGAIPTDSEDSPPVESIAHESSAQPQPAQPEQQMIEARPPQVQERTEEAQDEEQQASAEMLPSMEALRVLEDLPAIPPPPPTPDFIDEVDPQTEEGLEVPMIEAPEEPIDQYSKQLGEDRTLNINVPPSVAQQLSKAQEELKKQQQSPQPDQQAQRLINPQPMPRPRLSPKVLPGPLLASQTYAARMGAIAFDAKFSQFGYYLQRMFETIQLQWYSLLNDVTIGQEHRPAFVVLEYDLNSDGNVVDVRVLDTNAGELAALLCRDAIESRAPFGPWTQQMNDQLGDQQTITLKFIYL